MSRRAAQWVPAGLIALALIPILAGTARLVQILGGPALIPPDGRFAASPAPVVIHVTAAIGYTVLGALQFSAAIRNRHPRWHRRAGRLLVALGLAAALSAIWMTLLLPHKQGTGEFLFGFRIVFGTAMAASLILGLLAIHHRDIAGHRAWMTRAYAIGLGAGTQAFTVGIGEATFGSGVVRTDLMLGAGWVINLVIAEVLIHRAARHRAPRPRPHTLLVGAQ